MAGSSKGNVLAVAARVAREKAAARAAAAGCRQWKAALCKLWEQGVCPLGDACDSAHGEGDFWPMATPSFSSSDCGGEKRQ
eukprot:CAMPEP_0177267172 /NCGR_PEP_ID=MMETSP0367-20130122/63094_1 /TAXON_ID=447022 ORGANISM="Scrippsiella hangoei-like, Strain SHHI-4" /NCGR_SAMPLE_ID=MMETSP0367 /ASSEMBLY_ACC=CAM_ASM_000362 /LENGTH=80 /DNA_ID=CAMNT_0018722627 /DNA_START=1 /DNA_END=240 /DNA_ORIENTATION=+